jgi:hypothetical protein
MSSHFGLTPLAFSASATASSGAALPLRIAATTAFSAAVKGPPGFHYRALLHKRGDGKR